MIFRFDESVLNKTYLFNPSNNSKFSFRDVVEKADIFSRHIKQLENVEAKVALVTIREPLTLIQVIAACWIARIIPAVYSPNAGEEAYEDIINEFGFDFIIADFDFNSSDLNSKKIGLDFDDPAVSIDNYTLEVNDSDIALLLFSSGTSGKQKCIPLSYSNLNNNIQVFADRLEFTSEHIFLCGSPLWHAHGLYNSFLTSFFLQASVIYAGPLNALNVTTLLNSISNKDRIVFHIAPSMIPILLMYAKKRHDKALPAFERVICGTSFLDANSKEEFEKVYNSTLLQQYGMTETLFMSINDLFSSQKPDSVGQPLNEVDLQIVNGSEILPVGESGSIRVKSKSCFGEYYKLNYQEESFDSDFFYTGDLGYLDEDNCLFITGREKDLIKKGGFSISSNVITEAILKVSNIIEAFTIGVKDAVFGEEIYSFYISENEILESDIRNELKKSIQGNLLPKRIFRIAEFPKTATGKVRKPEMEQMLSSLLNE